MTKSTRFECWFQFYQSDKVYHDRCASLSVSGTHVYNGSDAEVSRIQCVVGTKVIKVFDDEVYVGTVTKVFDDDQLWHIQYEDGDTEDMDGEEIEHARRLYVRNNELT